MVVAFTPGWCRLWYIWTIVWRHSFGTSGRAFWPSLISQYKKSPGLNSKSSMCSPGGWLPRWWAATSGQVSWLWPSAEWSMMWSATGCAGARMGHCVDPSCGVVAPSCDDARPLTWYAVPKGTLEGLERWSATVIVLPGKNLTSFVHWHISWMWF